MTSPFSIPPSNDTRVKVIYACGRSLMYCSSHLTSCIICNSEHTHHWHALPASLYLKSLNPTDWVPVDPSAVPSEPNLRATWLGRALCSSRPRQLTDVSSSSSLAQMTDEPPRPYPSVSLTGVLPSSFWLPSALALTLLSCFALSPSKVHSPKLCRGLLINTQFLLVGPSLNLKILETSSTTPKIRLGSAQQFLAHCEVRMLRGSWDTDIAGVR
ncbi:hypothetical protein DFH94DRAFT_27529 [Russula ochroleuca]|uniref:Uncharacterized protein n=1 Tax=Russula ochroleuca TaxID=152965 RepID=A0A9P5N6H8_9AGAM|nr:hypothetical protein DFH94DRAFT_27529 [Russula ochroleuca]